MLKILIALLLLLVLVACNTVWDENYTPDGTQPDADGYYQSSAGSYLLRYKRIGSDSLECIMSANTTGWIAVGFDPSLRMKDANIIIGYVSDGDGFIRDDWGVSQVSHEADVALGGFSNVRLMDASEDGTSSRIRFRIPLNSGDSRDRILTPGNTYNIIFAHGDEDDFEAYHSGSATGQIRIP